MIYEAQITALCFYKYKGCIITRTNTGYIALNKHYPTLKQAEQAITDTYKISFNIFCDIKKVI